MWRILSVCIVAVLGISSSKALQTEITELCGEFQAYFDALTTPKLTEQEKYCARYAKAEGFVCGLRGWRMFKNNDLNTANQVGNYEEVVKLRKEIIELDSEIKVCQLESSKSFPHIKSVAYGTGFQITAEQYEKAQICDGKDFKDIKTARERYVKAEVGKCELQRRRQLNQRQRGYAQQAGRDVRPYDLLELELHKQAEICEIESTKALNEEKLEKTP